MSLLYVSEHSKHFLKPVKKLGSGCRPTHPIGTNSQICPFFFKASLNENLGNFLCLPLLTPCILPLQIQSLALNPLHHYPNYNDKLNRKQGNAEQEIVASCTGNSGKLNRKWRQAEQILGSPKQNIMGKAGKGLPNHNHYFFQQRYNIYLM